MSLNAQKTREFSPNVLRRIKLRTRLFVTFLIISLVPVITIGIFSYHAYTQSMNEKVKQAALQSIELLNNNMSTQLGIYSDYIPHLVFHCTYTLPQKQAIHKHLLNFGNPFLCMLFHCNTIPFYTIF